MNRARAALRRGDALEAQGEIDALVAQWSHLRKPSSSADEPFPLVTVEGRQRGLMAPRWLCHLLGLRHESVHVVLVLPNGLLVLQKRSRDKDTAPGLLDTSVGGHVGARRGALEAAHAEMQEELGLAPGDLAAPLAPIAEPFLVVDPRRAYVDAEVVTAFLGRLAPGALDRVRFTDGEVTRLVLAPPDEVWALLARGDRALAAGARAVLPRALALIEASAGRGGLAIL